MDPPPANASPTLGICPNLRMPSSRTRSGSDRADVPRCALMSSHAASSGPPISSGRRQCVSRSSYPIRRNARFWKLFFCESARPRFQAVWPFSRSSMASSRSGGVRCSVASLAERPLQRRHMPSSSMVMSLRNTSRSRCGFSVAGRSSPRSRARTSTRGLRPCHLPREFRVWLSPALRSL